MRVPILLSLVAGALVLPRHDLVAQSSHDVRYTTVSKFEFGGRLGRVLRVFGGGRPTTETTWYSESRMRTDREKRSTVVDAAAGTTMELEHEPKTYWLWSVNEPVLVIETIPDSVTGPPPARRRPRERYTVSLSTDRPGGRQRLAGLDAEQVIVTLQIDGETYNEDADSIERGTLVVLSDVWLTPSFPGTQAQHTFDSAWAARTTRDIDSAEAARAAQAMEQAYAEDPRLRVGVNKLDSALAALQGTSLKTTSHYVAVEYGARFDREAVLRDAEKSLVADVAEGAAQGAVNQGRARLGRLTGGRLGGQSASRPTQAVIMRTRHEITELSTGPIPADKFQPPSNYRRRTPGEGRN